MLTAVFLALVWFGCEDKPVILSEDVPNIPQPMNLSAVIGTTGVTLDWDYDAGFNYDGFDIFRSEDDQQTWNRLAKVSVPPYVDSTVRTGFPYWYQVSGIDPSGLIGPPSAPLPVFPSIFEVLINGGADFTSSRNVTLVFTAPEGTQNVRYSEQSDFSDTQWRNFLFSYNFELSAGEGLKTVYVQFRDVAGNRTESFVSTITFDEVAEIESLSLAPTSIAPGGTVNFTVTPVGNELDGFALVFIEGLGDQPLTLLDDGYFGDGTAGDGVYARAFTFPLFFRMASMRCSATFDDAAGNQSPEVEFADNLTMTDPPAAVILLDATETTQTSITPHWSKSNEEHFVSYNVYRSTFSPVTTTSGILAGKVTDIENTTYTDTGLTPGTPYFYAIFVVNDLDEETGSNELQLSTDP